MSTIRIVVLTAFVVGALSAGADVKKEEKTQVQFTGMLGAMAKITHDFEVVNVPQDNGEQA